ncbi:MAG TPA: hypothetical protein DEV93_12280, partial [Chloroflexi bacterium]|nr:hypothetical protein [Chloroflexota bacterium]
GLQNRLRGAVERSVNARYAATARLTSAGVHNGSSTYPTSFQYRPATLLGRETTGTVTGDARRWRDHSSGPGGEGISSAEVLGK